MQISKQYIANNYQICLFAISIRLIIFNQLFQKIQAKSFPIKNCLIGRNSTEWFPINKVLKQREAFDSKRQITLNILVPDLFNTGNELMPKSGEILFLTIFARKVDAEIRHVDVIDGSDREFVTNQLQER